MTYGHVWALLIKCSVHPDKQGAFLSERTGKPLCGACIDAEHDLLHGEQGTLDTRPK